MDKKAIFGGLKKASDFITGANLTPEQKAQKQAKFEAFVCGPKKVGAPGVGIPSPDQKLKRRIIEEY